MTVCLTYVCGCEAAGEEEEVCEQLREDIEKVSASAVGVQGRLDAIKIDRNMFIDKVSSTEREI